MLHQGYVKRERPSRREQHEAIHREQLRARQPARRPVRRLVGHSFISIGERLAADAPSERARSR